MNYYLYQINNDKFDLLATHIASSDGKGKNACFTTITSNGDMIVTW